MKYIIPQEKLEKIVFRYLDLQYGDLEEFKPEHYEGIVFKKPNDDSEFGIMGWEKSDTLYIYYKLIEEISSIFSIEESDSKEIIGKWIEDRYKLKVVYTYTDNRSQFSVLKIDIN